MLYTEPVTQPLPAPPTAETRLLAQAQRLDHAALSQIHDTYYPALYRYALYRTSDAPVAEDIAGETLMRLLDALHHRKPIQNLRAWLFGVAAHLVADHFRRAPAGELPESLPAADAPASEVEDRLRQQAVQQALHTLTEEQQTVLALRFGDGYSVEETANTLGKTLNAVKALQFRALGALRRALARAGEVFPTVEVNHD